MFNEANSVIGTNGYAFFKSLLLLYPESYRKKFEQEMLITFEDLYQERLVKQNLAIIFWVSLSVDIINSAARQHIQLAEKQGMRKYLQQTLHINKFNIIGGIFLLPAFLIFCIDIISRIAQGDLVHYNRPVYHFLSQTPLYWFPVLFVWVILFPFLTVLINAIPLIKNIRKKHGHVNNIHFLIHNLITILLLLFAAFFILLIKFHDFGPCMFHGITRLGFEHFTHIVAVCKNA